MKTKIILCVMLLLGPLWAEDESEDLSFAKDFVRQKGIWHPPWDQPKTIPELVMPLEVPFTYDAMERDTFLTYDEAKVASKKVEKERFLGITKFRENEYDVNYLVFYDLSPIIPDVQRELWLEKVHQYALYKAFEWNKRGYVSVKDGKFYGAKLILGADGYGSLGENLDEAKKQVKQYEDAVISKNISYGKVYYSATRPEHVDLLKEAQPWIDLVNFAYEWSVVEELEGFRLGPPSLDKKGVRLFHEFLRGWCGQVNYVRIGDINNRLVSGVTINHVERPLDFINDVLTGYLDDRDKCEVQGTDFGKVYVSINGGKSYVWMIDDRTYMQVGSHKETFAAYLKRYPSVLPVDLKIDKEAWMRRQVADSIKRLEKYAAAEPDDREQSAYQNEYQYFCRFVEPVEGAPFFWGWLKKIGKDEERYHFSIVKEWWEKNHDRYSLRKNAPLAVREVTREGHGGHKNSDDEVTKAFRERSDFYWRSKRILK